MSAGTFDPSTALQQARTEDLTAEEIIRYKCVGNNEQQILPLLTGPGCHLLEGSRGVGKSMLLKLAEMQLDERFPIDKAIGVYVTFKSSVLLENDRFSNELYSFRIWVMAKILQAFTDKLLKLGLIEGASTLDPYKRLLDVSDMPVHGLSLDHKITKLQMLALTKDSSERARIEKEIGADFAETFNNVDLVTNTIRDICKTINVSRVVFLFDEAAHTFISDQQKIFFDMVKLLHGNEVSVKVAVYPGVTSYGGNFEYGQDAIPIPLERYDMYTSSARNENRTFFRELLSKRLGNSPLAKKFFNRGEALDLAIYLSNGNPRALLHIMSKFDGKEEFSVRNVLLRAAEYVESELVLYHKELSKRLPRLASIVDLGFDVLRNYIVPEIKKKNEGKGPAYRKQTAFFTLEKECHFKIHRATELLCYSGLLIRLGFVKIRDRKTAPRYAVNLGLLVTDRAFASAFARRPLEAISRISKDDYREFYYSDVEFEKLVEQHRDKLAPCTHCGKERESYQHQGCPYCMTPYPKDEILPALLEDGVEKLAMSGRIKEYVRADGRFIKVKNILSSSLEELDTIFQVGPVRARIIRNAAEEYVSG
jgi:hypothetical protein